MQIRRFLLVSSVISTLSFSSAFAADQTFTCPSDLKKNAQGLWYSEQKPGWQSTAKLDDKVTLDAKNFGGAVYSPSHKRIACVYRSSDDKWVALISEQNPNIQINKDSKDDSGKELAWKFSSDHNDYACGKPAVSDISKCQFTFPNS